MQREVLDQLNPYTLKGQGVPEEIKNKMINGTFTIDTDFNIDVFTSLFPEFKDLLVDNNTKYIFLFAFYKNLAIKTFDKERYGELQLYCIGLYVAHHLQLSINRSKNLGNVANLNTTKPSETVNRNVGAKEIRALKTNFENEYRETSYGVELYPYMRIISQMSIKGVY